MQAAVLANAVKHNDRVIHRESDEGEKRRNHSKTDFPLKNGKESQRHEDIMEHGDNSRRTIGPFKSQSDVDKNSNEGGESYRDGLVSELGSGDRADGISTHYLVRSIWITR